MKFLIFGASGMIGHTVALYLKERGNTVADYSRRGGQRELYDRGISSYQADIIGNTGLIRDVLKHGDYDAVVNLAGVTNKAADNPANRAETVYLNSYFPHLLSSICAEESTYLIHQSTDCVFSGRSGSYFESDPCDAKSFYGLSKALGELDNDRDLTLRTSVIGPDINPDGIGLVNWFMGQAGPIRGYDWVFWNGVTSLQLAKIIEQAAAAKDRGLIQPVPSIPITKYSLLLKLNNELRGEAQIEIQPASAPRRLNMALIPSDGWLTPDYPYMIGEMASWMREHKELYPHYQLSGV